MRTMKAFAFALLYAAGIACAHAHGLAKAPRPPPIGDLAGARVPWIDEPECVGCNLCQLVCPVEGCITMAEVPNGTPETWNDRVAQGRDKVPGGIHDR